MKEMHLIETNIGIEVPSPHAFRIMSGDQKSLVFNEFSRRLSSSPLYIVENGMAFGIIKLGSPERIDMEEFQNHFHLHKMTEEERVSTFGDKMVLFEYRTSVLEKFDTPRPVQTSRAKNASRIKEIMFSDDGTTDTESPNISKVQGKSFIKRRKKRKDIYSKFEDRVDMKNLDKLISTLVNMRDVITEIRLGELFEFLAFPKPAVSDIESFNIIEPLTIERIPDFPAGQIHKGDGKIVVFDSNGHEISEMHGEIVDSIHSVTSADVILDGFLGDGMFIVTDISFFDRDIYEQSWTERNAILKKLEFNSVIKRNPSLLVDTKEELEAGVNMMNSMENSRGTLAKLISKPYPLEERTDDWIVFKK